jgi:hypothetical protein
MTTQSNAIAQDSEIIELSPKELLPILTDHAINGETVGLEGPPGSAKSDLVAQAAKAAGLPLMILNLELSDTTDGKGLPFRDPDNRNQIVWLKDKRWLVDYPFANFMDELPRAVVPVQGTAATLMLENRIDDLYLPKGTWHVWAGNRTADKAGANRVPSIIYQRSFMYATAYSAESQVEWMIQQSDLDLLTMRFLRLKGDAALSFDPNKKVNPTSRSWTKVAKKLFAKPDAHFATIAGMIGKGLASELLAFRQLAPSLPSPEEVLMNPKGARVPENISAQFLITDMLADLASFNNFDTLVEYAQRIVPEMQAKFVKDSMTRCPEITNTRAFTTWGIKFAEVLR